MRLLLASVAALTALAIAAPSYAQEDPAATPTPVTKPKPGTAAYCSTMKTTTSKNACLKRLHAQATPKKAPTSASKAKAKKLTPPADTSAQLSPPPAAPAATPSPAPSSSSAPTQNVAVPPLPQKTI
jgi:hypothetical protein